MNRLDMSLPILVTPWFRDAVRVTACTRYCVYLVTNSAMASCICCRPGSSIG